jgi:hypothetical protein
MDEVRAARLREEARILFRLRNAAIERLEAGNTRAEPMLRAVTELIAQREAETEAALLPCRSSVAKGSGFAYDWELRVGEEVVSTGRLYEDTPLKPGDHVSLGRRELVIREILPGQQDIDGRLILVPHRS